MTDARAVLVTGASSGIGAACARRLDTAGWWVFAGVRASAGVAAFCDSLRLEVASGMVAMGGQAVAGAIGSRLGQSAEEHQSSASGAAPDAAVADRLRLLGEDPAIGGFRKSEMETALRVETESRLSSP